MDVEHWMLDNGCRTMDVEQWMLRAESGGCLLAGSLGDSNESLFNFEC